MSSNNCINWTTPVEDILKNCPESIKIGMKYGIKLLTCGDVFWGTLEDLCRINNYEMNEEFLKELNEKCCK